MMEENGREENMMEWASMIFCLLSQQKNKTNSDVENLLCL
jgi:hypothetical protein